MTGPLQLLLGLPVCLDNKLVGWFTLERGKLATSTAYVRPFLLPSEDSEPLATLESDLVPPSKSCFLLAMGRPAVAHVAGYGPPPQSALRRTKDGRTSGASETVVQLCPSS